MGHVRVVEFKPLGRLTNFIFLGRYALTPQPVLRTVQLVSTRSLAWTCNFATNQNILDGAEYAFLIKYYQLTFR